MSIKIVKMTFSNETPDAITTALDHTVWFCTKYNCFEMASRLNPIATNAIT